MQNDTVDDQYDINNSEMMEIVGIKRSEIVNLKDDRVFLLDSMIHNFQDKPVKHFWIMIKIMMNILQKTFC